MFPHGKSLGLLALFSLILTGCGSDSSNDRPSPPPPVTATTLQGEVAGQERAPENATVDGTLLVWWGIPYARPPVDDLRWRAPQPPESWSGVRDATEPASRCVQAETTLHWVRTQNIIGDEDCLYLDIYRPSRADWQQEQLPVYVWIHGGSNNFGTAMDYDGGNLALHADAVVVVIQYRLGPLGWFFQPEVQTGGADPLSDSGNFGNLDQIQALRWVRDNAAAFGGDPDQITIAGESAGGHNVMTLLVSPQAQGLFHKAMAQSPAMATRSPAEAEAFTNEQIDYLLRYRGDAGEASEAAALRQQMVDDGTLDEYLFQIPAHDYYAAVLAYTSLSAYGATEDGVVVPSGGWMPAIRAGEYNSVPLIIGANEYEQKAFMPLYGALVKALYDQPSGDYTWLNLKDVMEGESKADGSPFTLDDVLPTERDRTIYELAGYHGSRAWRAKYVDELAAALAQRQEDVFAYDFRWGGPGSGPEPFDFIYGAGHSAEISFFHGREEGLFGYPFTADNEAGRRDLQDAMMTYVKHFLRQGDPSGGCDEGCPPRWMPWSGEGSDTVIVLDADLEQAHIEMSGEALTLESVEEDREAAISAYDEGEKNAVRHFASQSPWPTP
ncbi:Carboxylesterase type B [Alloalcanivorax dieselolei B5]|uniref:Carboxylic ester hydrolase n=1 Tax=Alcanivorax dieselolei (strain DSM 16502 / CGMCC 1.3690 / MCCC 1A00001 / B-5) TaxID=930169 RepID=K0C7C8_ALCDB|nr:carboxylesterase family protein [Alloalcanivorax dieselolei]AFT68443.1 Carboxylesterase type B [Alloalcanivorax dieselolei B5]GGJ99646.1 carboxylesterase [Alloalcanivorax dieselolei]